MHEILEEYYKKNNRRKPNVIVDDIEKLTQLEWLQTRQKGIGGSDSGPIYFGSGHFRTAFQISIDKMSEITSVKDNSPGQQYIFDRGHAMEDVLIKWYGNKYNAEVFTDRGMYCNPEYPFMLADCDGFAKLENGEVIGLEFKTTMFYNGKNWNSGVYGVDGEIGTDDYLCQVMHYMAVFDLDRYDIICDYGEGTENGIKVVTVKRDQLFIDNLIEREEYFWLHLDEVEISQVKKEKIIETSELIVKYNVKCGEVNDVVEELAQLENQLKSLSKAKETIQNSINAKLSELMAICEKQGGRPIKINDGNEVLYITNPEEQRSFDTTKMKKLGYLDDKEFIEKGLVKTKTKDKEIKIIDLKKFERKVKKGEIIL